MILEEIKHQLQIKDKQIENLHQIIGQNNHLLAMFKKDEPLIEHKPKNDKEKTFIVDTPLKGVSKKSKYFVGWKKNEVLNYVIHRRNIKPKGNSILGDGKGG